MFTNSTCRCSAWSRISATSCARIAPAQRRSYPTNGQSLKAERLGTEFLGGGAARSDDPRNPPPRAVIGIDEFAPYGWPGILRISATIKLPHSHLILHRVGRSDGVGACRGRMLVPVNFLRKQVNGAGEGLAAACRSALRGAAQYRHQLAPFPRQKAARSLVQLLAFDHPTNDGEAGGRDGCCVHPVFEKGGVGHRDPARERL